MTFCFLRDPLRCESEKEKDFLDWASRMVNSELSLSIKESMFGIVDNDSKFCLALNHLVIIGKYFLYVKALNGKFYILNEFVFLARDKISLENIFLVRLVAKKISEQNGLFFRLF